MALLPCLALSILFLLNKPLKADSFELSVFNKYRMPLLWGDMGHFG